MSTELTKDGRRKSDIPWVGSLPINWEVKVLKRLVDGANAGEVIDRTYWGEGDELLYTCAIDPMKSNYSDFPNWKRTEENDLLVTRNGTPYVHAPVVGSTYSNVVQRISLNQDFHREFIKIALQCSADNSLRGYGVSIESYNYEIWKRLVIPIPPYKEQVAIVNYLNTETKRIDWLINEKESLLKLLIELRGGIIRELTAGIHLKSAMQETGNVFMPVIPSDWDMSGIGRFSSLGNGSTPLKDNTDYWNGGTYPWLNSSVVNQDEVTEGSEFVTESALKQCHLPIVHSGSVLVALTGQGKTRGQATMLRIEATINQHLAYIQTDGERLDGEYLFWVLSGQFSALRMISDGQGGTKGALTCDDLRKFQIPLPPLKVQKDIAARLYEDTRRVDDLVEYAKKEIAVLAELRSSTITDAVLGRIDVRKAQAH